MHDKFKKRKFFSKKYVPRERRKTRMLIFILVWGVIFMWLTENFVISLEVVKGRSMYPTLEDGNYHLVNKFIYNFKRPKRQDVVVIKNIWLRKEEIIKRVIGIPGDVVEVKNGRVYINGGPLSEFYARGRTYPAMAPVKVGEERYFVLGDNRPISYDSRNCGLIKRSEIRGKLAPDRLFTLK